ncbi:MAG TPA: carboxylating nicotinate-nucleotide diphosphorylase [Candidatus Desulfofervidus auxilii]|uniref:nicotinate-nucleotide diphosphorylase (carboxylating) n=1 Tax=Desulfofervidus auxilii TaxID=1621989 RepID=A0A7C0Y980_DESA2|nr:carboxylating nicotinate-nucleotide diphosphorylase [Candidatus Desulfofervidus auxilii]
MYLPETLLKQKLLDFLKSDLAWGDITTDLLIPPEKQAEAFILIKEPAILAGLYESIILFSALGIKTESPYQDGEKIKENTKILFLKGKARDILIVERTALNILMRMTSIATQTYKLQEKIKTIGSRSKVAATRKTLPGWGYFDKKAVAIGGGDTHRFNLSDLVLIKDNHLILFGNLINAIKKVKEKISFTKKIEVEVCTPEEALFAAQAGADIIMLDNFSPSEVKKTIEKLEQKGLRGKVILEVSGGINFENILDYAIYNPDIISCGALTHSVKAIDMSLKIIL